jgi:aspartyl-tRNA(Asn)/glutamyl-tRNA(Gln) amidotransferase subunit A
MEIVTMTIEEIQQGYREKRFTVQDVVNAYFERIEAFDGKIRAFITLCKEEALAEAAIMDKKLEQGKEIGLLGGIPIAIKDLICTKGIRTTCASRMLADFLPPYDATVIRKLKEAGAIIIGKTNMDEFAMGSSTENSAMQITTNPWDITRVPGGSSGGSAAAVTAGFAPIALGSDTGGSVRQPAAFCGNVGFKPTYGAVSRYGLIAFASSLDQIGPFAGTVRDCAISLQAIQGTDEMDGTSVQYDLNADYLKTIEDGVKGLKIGVPEEFFKEGLDPEIDEKIKESIQLLQEAGATVESFSLPITEAGLSAYYIISSAEASSNLARYDGVRYGHRTAEYESFDEMILKSRQEAFGNEVKRRIMLGTYVLSSGYYDAYYKKAMMYRKKMKLIYENAFREYDLILSPTSPVLPFKIGEKTKDPLEMYLSDIYTVGVNIAGLPAISIPCGFSSEGLPIGLQMIGNYYAEETVLRTARTLEKSLCIEGLRPNLDEHKKTEAKAAMQIIAGEDKVVQQFATRKDKAKEEQRCSTKQS